MISEAHYARDRSGAVAALDGVSGDGMIDELCGHDRTFRVWLAARCETVAVMPPGAHPLTRCGFVPLPAKGSRPLRNPSRSAAQLLHLLTSVSSASAVLVKAPAGIGLLPGLVAALMRRPLIVFLVGDIASLLASGAVPALSGWKGRLFRLLNGLLLRSAQLRRSVAAALLESPEGTKRQRQAMVLSDVQIGDHDIASTAKQYPGDGAVIVLSVGSQSNSYKGHQDIIRAIPLLREAGIPAQLVLLGGGAYQPVLRRLVSEMELEHCVSFHPPVPHRQVYELMDAADVYVQAAATEGMPRVILEAMSRGLPAGASRVGGTRDVLRDEEMFTPGDVRGLTDVVLRLLHPDTYRAASERNLRIASRYTASSLLPQRLEWYARIDALCSGHG